MQALLNRPEHLPDFQSPPLNEVVLGVQFKPPQGYQQIMAGDVRSLYREDFPGVQELPPLLPAFETFGPAGVLSTQINFGFTSGATHDRFWFLSPNGAELIQFQQDRLLHNWRKIGDQTNEYPRFERMIERFEVELHRLEEYFASLSPQRLDVTQCEISYVNHILSRDPSATVRSGDWLRFLDFGNEDQPDDFSLSFRQTIRGADGKPRGRLICEAATALNQKNQRMIVLTLTARGAPYPPDIDGALGFLKMGRESIVRTFAIITTDSAHRDWGRVQ